MGCFVVVCLFVFIKASDEGLGLGECFRQSDHSSAFRHLFLNSVQFLYECALYGKKTEILFYFILFFMYMIFTNFD